MDLVRHLRLFVVVAEERHFGRAAERLGMAQPPLSQRIRRLEAELDARLFDRDSRGVRLTEAGAVLLAESRDLLDRVERTRSLVTRAARGELGELRVGVPPEVPGAVLATIVRRFAADSPEVRLDLRELTTTEQVRLLTDRELDVGLLQQPADLTGLTEGPGVDTPVGAVVPRDSALAGRDRLALADLAGHDLVLFPRATAPGRYDATLKACQDNGFRPSRVAHAASPEFACGLVLAGRGVALAPDRTARHEPRVVWRPLVDDPVVWRMSFAWPDSPHPAAERLCHTAIRVLRDDGTSRPVVPARDAPAPWDVVYHRVP
ncbi:LysR substrate-binding domain-containing protein [Actinocatenispora rupis]|uniref:LysR family transcriptional regulator n=1 Tax=Actinocatenispora rupis TaxID=519421 RepID=A0A8J3J7E7_9ACTN|nr:LysR substrate-binding domain-containing protein [Actinocatenispora rupis]GID13405.1 LysR family transcriptional regulator [Actinocatenispora rupis]